MAPPSRLRKTSRAPVYVALFAEWEATLSDRTAAPAIRSGVQAPTVTHFCAPPPYISRYCILNVALYVPPEPDSVTLVQLGRPPEPLYALKPVKPFMLLTKIWNWHPKLPL